MSTKIDIQGPLLVRVLDADGVRVCLERYVRKDETLIIDTEPEEAQANVVTVNLTDEVRFRDGV